MKSLNNLNAKFADINVSYQERKIALQVLEEIMADLEAINRNYYNLLLETDESVEYIVSEIETEDFYKMEFLNAKSNFKILENQRRNKVENAKVYFQEILIEKKPTFEMANIEKRPTFEMANIVMVNNKNSPTLEMAYGNVY